MRIAVLCLITTSFLIAEPPHAVGQIRIRSSASNPGGAAVQGPKVGDRRFADTPLARIWHSKISAMSGFQYMQKVTKEMEMKGSSIMMLPPGAGEIAGPAMDTLGTPSQELKGMLVYLAKGLIPTPETFNFKRVADEKEFRKLVMQRKAGWGEAAKLIGKGDRYEVKVDFASMAALAPGSALPPPGAPKDGDEERTETRAVIAFSARVGSSPPGGEAPAPIEAPSSMSTFYRYHDGIMFDSQAPELHEMKLPNMKDLTLKKSQDSLDLYADVDLSQIPQAFKEVFWNAIKVKANSFLQQYDEEPDEEYAVRKSSGQFTMELTRAAILDVDRIRLSLSFAKGEKPLNIDVVVDARKNSNLAKQLGQVSRGASRFDGLRREASPMTIASAWQMPDNFRTMLKAMFEKGKVRMEEQLATDADGLLAVEEIFQVLSETIDGGAADAIMKLGGDAKTGYALYGGMRIAGADRLARNLSTALNGLPSTVENEIHVSREDGREFLSFRLDELRLPGLTENEQLPGQLHFTVADSCLWFSVGGPTSFEVLKSCVASQRESKTDRSIPAAPFVLDLKLSDWLKSEETVAPNRFSEVPMQTLQRFEQAVHRSFANQFKFSFAMPGQEPDAPKMEFRDSYLAKTIKAGRDELHVEIDTSPKTVRAKARIGEGIIKFVVARFLEVQHRAMENVSFQVIDSEDGRSRSITVKGGSGTVTAPGGK